MGITINELKAFLERLPETMGEFSMVNGEVLKIDDEYYGRVDKPIIEIRIDEESREFVLLHQSREEINNILKEVNNGNSK